MEAIEIINLWKTQDAKIEQTLAINKLMLKELVNQKVHKIMKSLNTLKLAGLILGFIFCFFLAFLLFFAISHYSTAWNYFILSLGVILVINIKALADYFKHLVWVNRINYNGSITEIQLALSELQLSIIKHSRIMWLQLPFWTTFYLSNKWFPHEAGEGFITLQLILTGSFIFASYWLFKNHSIKNLDKKWFQKLIAGSGGKSVLQAMEFYREIAEFKKEA